MTVLRGFFTALQLQERQQRKPHCRGLWPRPLSLFPAHPGTDQLLIFGVYRILYQANFHFSTADVQGFLLLPFPAVAYELAICMQTFYPICKTIVLPENELPDCSSC